MPCTLWFLRSGQCHIHVVHDSHQCFCAVPAGCPPVRCFPGGFWGVNGGGAGWVLLQQLHSSVENSSRFLACCPLSVPSQEQAMICPPEGILLWSFLQSECSWFPGWAFYTSLLKEWAWSIILLAVSTEKSHPRQCLAACGLSPTPPAPVMPFQTTESL